jgi:hypothetical protein
VITKNEGGENARGRDVEVSAFGAFLYNPSPKDVEFKVSGRVHGKKNIPICIASFDPSLNPKTESYRSDPKVEAKSVSSSYPCKEPVIR